MPREVCYTCRRAKIACLCGRVESQANNIKVIVLQHPDESSNAKGSAIIAELGLNQYQRWIGEDFRQHAGLNACLQEFAHEILILYPSPHAQVLTDKPTGAVKYLLIIDATWRKARRIWEINPQLQALRCVKLANNKSTHYRIRKAPQPGYLSTVESIVEGLRILEGDENAYQPLLTLFDEMIDFQIANMGNATYKRNYLGE